MADQTQNQKLSKFKILLIYLFIAFLAFMIVDLVYLKNRVMLFPKVASSKKDGATPSSFGNRFNQANQENGDLEPFANYRTILDRNIFNADGEIPPPLSAKKRDKEKDDPVAEEDSDPVLTSLPFKLEGTVVHRDPYRSLGTVAINDSDIQTYMVGDVIDNKAEVISVVRKKLIFRNKNNRKLEYIEIPRGLKLAKKKKPPRKKAPRFSAKPSSAGQIVSRSGNDFSVNRADVAKQLSNVGDLLRQAKAVPAIDPNTGEITGFRLDQLRAGSVFEQLGLQVGDVIKSANGEPVTSTQKAMELYQSLKTSDEVSITINRGGRDQDFTYSVRD